MVENTVETIEKRSTFTPSAWKTARTVTGSVAEMSAPKKSEASPPSEVYARYLE